VGYTAKVHTLAVDAFPNQYRALDKVLGIILEHVGENTTLFIISDHGIKPLREMESHMGHRDHAGTTPIIAKHDFEDGDDVPGAFIAMGPGIKKGVRVMGLPMSVFDIAPTVLHIYGLSATDQMKGRVLSEIFEGSPAGAELSANTRADKRHQLGWSPKKTPAVPSTTGSASLSPLAIAKWVLPRSTSGIRPVSSCFRSGLTVFVIALPTCLPKIPTSRVPVCG
jgi:hypothetical protein